MKLYNISILILIEKFHFQKENKNYTTNPLKLKGGDRMKFYNIAILILIENGLFDFFNTTKSMTYTFSNTHIIWQIIMNLKFTIKRIHSN